MNNNKFKGIIAYPITPFKEDENINLPLFKKLVERLVINKANVIAPLGSTGVLPYLNDSEKENIIKATIDQVKGRIPVLVGVSNLTTERTIHHAKYAEKQGADNSNELLEVNT